MRCLRLQQGQMDYMATSAQLQAAQYGQYAAAQQYQQQPGLLYGGQQLPAAQYPQYPAQQQQAVRTAPPHAYWMAINILLLGLGIIVLLLHDVILRGSPSSYLLALGQP